MLSTIPISLTTFVNPTQVNSLKRWYPVATTRSTDTPLIFPGLDLPLPYDGLLVSSTMWRCQSLLVLRDKFSEQATQMMLNDNVALGRNGMSGYKVYIKKPLPTLTPEKKKRKKKAPPTPPDASISIFVFAKSKSNHFQPHFLAFPTTAPARADLFPPLPHDTRYVTDETPFFLSSRVRRPRDRPAHDVKDGIVAREKGPSDDVGDLGRILHARVAVAGYFTFQY